MSSGSISTWSSYTFDLYFSPKDQHNALVTEVSEGQVCNIRNRWAPLWGRRWRWGSSQRPVKLCWFSASCVPTSSINNSPSARLISAHRGHRESFERKKNKQKRFNVDWHVDIKHTGKSYFLNFHFPFWNFPPIQGWKQETESCLARPKRCFAATFMSFIPRLLFPPKRKTTATESTDLYSRTNICCKFYLTLSANIFSL